MLPIAAVFLGEVAALDALAFPIDAGPGEFAVVASSLVASTVALVLAVMADVSPPTGDEHMQIERASRSAEEEVAEVNAPPTAQTLDTRDTIEEAAQSLFLAFTRCAAGGWQCIAEPPAVLNSFRIVVTL